jgi:hypothetical protein
MRFPVCSLPSPHWLPNHILGQVAGWGADSIRHPPASSSTNIMPLIRFGKGVVGYIRVESVTGVRERGGGRQTTYDGVHAQRRAIYGTNPVNLSREETRKLPGVGEHTTTRASHSGLSWREELRTNLLSYLVANRSRNCACEFDERLRAPTSAIGRDAVIHSPERFRQIGARASASLATTTLRELACGAK